MMDNARSGRFEFVRLSLLFIGFLATVACGTALASVRAELSSGEATDGSLIVVTVRSKIAVPEDQVAGEYDGVPIPFFSSGGEPGAEAVYEAVVGVPYGHKPGRTEVKIRVGQGDTAHAISLPLVVTDGGWPSESLKVSPRHTNPSRKDMVRIMKEKAEVGKIYASIRRQKYWKGSFVLPVQSQITSRFGTKRVFNGTMQSFHNGVDLRAPIGTPISAPAPGVVVLAKDLFFSGKTVLVDHGYGLFTMYAHLSKLKVKKGQVVKPGALLGLAGKTGRAAGPHLHWGAIVNKTKVNPLDLTKVLR